MEQPVTSKEQLLSAIRDIFNRWEALLAGMSETQIIDPRLPGGWSIKDTMAHLWGWQQRSLARSEAALRNEEPDYPKWPESLGPDLEEDVDRTNGWIYETYRDKPWPNVYADWQSQFLRWLELSEQIPEEDLMRAGRYAWMGGWPLAASLQGSFEHHEEHYDLLTAWLREHGSMKSAN